jgi:hypothetical protein
VKIKAWLLLSVLVLFYAHEGVLATDTKYSRETLKGVKSIAVLIEALDPDALAAGVSEPQLQTAVELKLR